MIYNVEDFKKSWPQTCIFLNGKDAWVFARPMSGPFIWRIKAAWEVLRGRADAIKWTGQP